MIRQTTGYGCGMYAVANALNLPHFVNSDRLEASKQGNSISQLTKWLLEDWHPFGLDVLFYDHFGNKLPDEHLHTRTDTEGAELPILLQVKSTNDIAHMVGGRLYHDGRLLLMDSLQKFPHLTTLQEVNEKLYKEVNGIFAFTYWDNGQWVVINPKKS